MKRAIVIGVLVVVAMSPSEARAESSRAGAAELREAVERLRDGRCDSAIPLLRRAWEVGHLRNALWNLAECYAMLGRPGPAIESYRDYLEHPSTRRNRRDQAAARSAIARLESSVARLSISSAVEGARVTIDGQVVGTTPVEPVVGTGLRMVEVTSPGFAPFRREVQIEAGNDRELEAPLEMLPGELSVESTPEGARVSINGREVGSTPWEGEIAGGGHLVEVALEEHRTETRRVTLAPGQRTTVELELRPSEGTLSVASTAPEAQLLIDDEVRGRSPFAPVTLTPGHYQLEVTAPGHVSWSGEVDVVDLRTTLVELEMPETGGIHRGWFWSMVGTTLAAAAAATVVMIVASQRLDEFEEIAAGFEGGVPPQNIQQEQEDGEAAALRASQMLTTGYTVIGFGGLTALTALVLGFFTNFSDQTATARTRVQDRANAPEAVEEAPR